MTATAQILNAQATAESVLGSWNVVHLDPFDTNEYNWLVETSEDEYASTTYEIVDGKYRWSSTAYKAFIGWVRADRTHLSDFYFSVEVQQMTGPDTADYGIVFREDDDSNFYYFGINDQSQYVLYVFFEEWETLVNFTESDLIKPGEVNRLAVIGEGSHFTFFINDQYLMEITDDKIPEGSVALAAELANENDQAVFEFDNFELRAP